jgi:hypothetical protein
VGLTIFYLEWVLIFVPVLKNFLIVSGGSRSRVIYLPLLIVFNVLFYLICILKAPGFSSDDFYIFYLISKDPLHPVSLNSQEIFFLFLRPVSYFSFWITYHILSADPVLMKLFSLLLHLGVVSILYLILVNLPEEIVKKRDHLLIGLLLLLFSVHPDVLMYIIHINNRTELLMLLFYSAAVLVTLKYVRGAYSGRKFIFTAALLYILSVLSKQNGMHFPLLLFFIPVFLKPDRTKWRSIGTLRAVSLLMMLLFTIINISLTEVSLSEADLIRKPFSAAGTLLFAAVPFIAGELYAWFLQNTDYIFTAVIALFALSAFIIIPPVKIKRRMIAMAFILCLFYPRIFALGGGRINTHLVMWMVILLYIILIDRKYIFRYFIPAALAVLFMLYSLDMAVKTAENNLLRKQQSFELHELTKANRKPFVVLSGMAASLYEYNYHVKGTFRTPEIDGNALVYKYLFPGRERNIKVISCRKEGDNFIFSSSDPEIFIGEHPVNKIYKKFKTEARGRLNREYCSYSIQIPETIIISSVLTYHNGQNWELIN